MHTPDPETTPDHRSATQRWLIFAYCGVAYLLFFATFLVLIAFVGDLWSIRSMARPWTVDHLAGRVAINAGLALLFAVQHTVMARGRFKEWLTKRIPQEAERSTFVLATVLVLAATVVFWQPLPFVLFELHGAARLVADTLFAFGFFLVLVSSFLLDHFHLFGLKQGVQAVRSSATDTPRFRTPLFYRWVRHPLMTGMIIGLWAAADLTVGRVLLAGAMTGYILIGLYFEERSLTRELGPVYLQYKQHVPSLFPTSLRPAWPPRTSPVVDSRAAPEAA